jgi:hypothetical protein
VAHNNAHETLDTLECKYEKRDVFGVSLDDRDVPSVCQISGLRISGRQFFPREGFSQGKKMFDMTLTVTVMG